MDHGTRDELLSRLAEAVGSVTVAHPTRVAIDGPPAAGKTTLADELAVVLRAQGRDVIRATIEDFLTPRSQRYRRGARGSGGSFELPRIEAQKRIGSRNRTVCRCICSYQSHC